MIWEDRCTISKGSRADAALLYESRDAEPIKSSPSSSLFFFFFFYTFYIYSIVYILCIYVLYISTVKSAIDGVDIDVVCNAGRKEDASTTTEPTFFNFPGYEAAATLQCVHIQKG